MTCTAEMEHFFREKIFRGSPGCIGDMLFWQKFQTKKNDFWSKLSKFWGQDIFKTKVLCLCRWVPVDKSVAAMVNSYVMLGHFCFYYYEEKKLVVFLQIFLWHHKVWPVAARGQELGHNGGQLDSYVMLGQIPSLPNNSLPRILFLSIFIFSRFVS